MSDAMIKLLLQGVLETTVMTFLSGAFGFLLGLPAGVLLFVTRPGQFWDKPWVYRSLSIAVNTFRAIPFLILIVWMIPFTRFLVGTSIGVKAALVPLSLGAAPFIARMVENSLLEIPPGLLEAARSMGATPAQTIVKVLLPEAMPSIVNGASVVLISLVGYSAMGGAVGAGGLGQIGYQYGYIGYDATVMNFVILLLVSFVFLIQYCGGALSKRLDHR